MGPALPANNPRATLFWVDEATLGIRWQDGHESRYSLPQLRQGCPCAACNEQRRANRGLTVLPGAGPVRAIEVQPIGRYAIKFLWSDNHDTGIYPYQFLRDCCSCELCRHTSEF